MTRSRSNFEISRTAAFQSVHGPETSRIAAWRWAHFSRTAPGRGTTSTTTVGGSQPVVSSGIWQRHSADYWEPKHQPRELGVGGSRGLRGADAAVTGRVRSLSALGRACTFSRCRRSRTRATPLCWISGGPRSETRRSAPWWTWRGSRSPAARSLDSGTRGRFFDSSVSRLVARRDLARLRHRPLPSRPRQLDRTRTGSSRRSAV